MSEKKSVLPPLFTSQFLARLETLRIRARRQFLGSRPGGHLSPRRGAGLEFADYRPYAPGDDPRYIDWKLYSRTDRPYIKLFQEEEELYTYVFIDLSASMAYPLGDGKDAAARDLGLALAYVVLASEDAVQLHALNGGASRNATPFFRGRQRLFDLALFLQNQRAQGKVDPPQTLAQHLRTVHRPGKAIWISDFLFPLEAAQAGLKLLRSADFDLAVIQVLGKEDMDPPLAPGGVKMVDSESREAAIVRFDAQAKKEYLRRLDLHNRTLRSYCHQTGVHYARFVTGQDLQHFVLRELPALRILT
ncbi:MAG TPA: DUF58 domain-containing protein [Methylomirabilota bacterium]|jgi:uncharacterized protein (DUF58 family)|nr:DUF58 domain-containing protein [Methylomirabilota bacterium]